MRVRFGLDKSIIRVIETYCASNPMPVETKSMLADVVRTKHYVNAEIDRALTKICRLLGQQPALILKPGEAWSDAAMHDLQLMPEAEREIWSVLLPHCRQATGGSPSAKWHKAASELLDTLGADRFATRMSAWLPLLNKPRTAPADHRLDWRAGQNDWIIIDPHRDILKGLAWCCGRLHDPRIGAALVDLALSSFRKLPGIGPRMINVGNACIWALGEWPGMEGVSRLAIIRTRVKFIPAQKALDKALNAVAQRENIPRDQIEEMAVPAYGMSKVGKRTEQFGEFDAELIVTGTMSTELRWIKRAGGGKAQKSIPKAVKNTYPDEVKELQTAGKDIQKMLPAQRERLDGLFLQRKTWAYATWAERYLNHPLVGTLARRLIWWFDTGKKKHAGIWLDGRLVNVEGSPLNLDADTAVVSLWHPLDAGTENVVAWRRFMDEHQIVQPFKQAHREVYLLTDAERTTRLYSNRYASHIIKQHQFNALAAIRGWKNALQLMVDQSFPPARRELPAWNLRAEFWVNGAGEEYNVDTNETGTFCRVSTDQVRFYPLNAPLGYGGPGYGGGAYGTNYGHADAEPVSLDQIPPLVFSEIMRDVDLFVGVASVGNDPAWQDGGPEGRYQAYWQQYSFGDLSATAQTRKDVLDRLIPRLKIAGQCSIDGKFLIVRGKVRTYKIHLGSGNIVMEPNDQYLCIVPGRGQASRGTEGVFLPFEGDQTLSIILSKAFLLAADDRITDQTILSQLRR